MKALKHIAVGLAVVMGLSSARAAAPSGYYTTCEGRTGQSLLTALNGVMGNHTTVSYSGLWELYRTSDVRPNGTIWDMYSTKEYRYKTDQCGQYKVVGDCYNREHSFPKSWFDDASPMVSDAFHIYPTDGKVNGQRSNYPFGECDGGTTLPSSNGVRALGRLGRSTFPGYSGTVFEPDDQYKGDFARSYFYMAAAYNGRIASWDSPMLAGNSYPAFSSWAIDLLLKWHRQDPVSQKEIDRNEAVYARQRNRNPFIDHPELAEYIWGDRQGQDWHPGGTPDPTLTLPVDGSALNLGTTVPGYARTATVNIKGLVLTGNITLSVSNQAFSVSPATISAAAANAGTVATVTFNPDGAGDFTGMLTVSAGSLSSRVNLSGKAISTLPAGPVTAVSDNSFVARWSNVGDADSRGEYTLDVQCDGVSLDEFPTSVTAADEAFLVEGLDANTTYTYYIKSQHLTSETVSVTTLTPQPLIEFLFDGELSFTSTPGEPSEAAELLLNIENITETVTVSVSAPFELSTDKSTWSTSLDLDPEEDRIYLRLNASTAGTYTTSIVATAGEYHTDRAEAEGNVVDRIGFIEDFETGNKADTYSNQQYQGTACLWNFTNTGIWGSDAAHSGNYAVRMGKTSTSSIEMAEEHVGGFGVVRFWAKRYGSDDQATIVLEYTTDGGSTWQSAGTAEISTTTYAEYTFTVNVSRPARLRLRQTAGERVNLDDIEASAFSGLVPAEVADYHRWDAFCRDGLLVIEASEDVDFNVYALDGTLLHSATAPAGETTVNLPAGLVIVGVDDFARRVLIK